MQNNLTDTAREKLVQAKLAAFKRIEGAFYHCFRFKEAMYGQQRLTSILIADTVYFLHALWMCECKDRLLSVPQTMGRYEGNYCLGLLRDWQEGKTDRVVAFLDRKLDHAPFAELTRQIAEAQAHGDAVLAERLTHGRRVMLQRNMHLMLALETIFVANNEQLSEKVRLACLQFRHTPQQIARQLAKMETPLYSYLRHPLLAQRNMLAMNALGVMTTDGANSPGYRTSRVEMPTAPQPSFAEHLVEREMTLITAPD